MNVLVAATLSSGPALSGRQRSAWAASGEASSFVSATVGMPARFASSWQDRMSGLLPDCDTVMRMVSRKSRWAPYTETTEGPSEQQGRPRMISDRYLK
jgi:hypothetical protein